MNSAREPKHVEIRNTESVFHVAFDNRPPEQPQRTRAVASGPSGPLTLCGVSYTLIAIKPVRDLVLFNRNCPAPLSYIYSFTGNAPRGSRYRMA